MFDGLKDMGNLMKQAKEMKSNMKKVQQELKQAKIESSFLEGKLSIVMNGEMEVLSLHIDESLLKEKNQKNLEEAIKKLFNKASADAKQMAASKLSGVTGGLNIPGLT